MRENEAINQPPTQSDRLAAAVNAADRAGERAIAIGQCLLAGFVILLHLIAAQHHAWQSINPVVLIGLSAILAMGAVRYRLAGNRILPERALTLLTVAEIATLFTIIWCYQHSYGHPPAGILKSSTVFLAFVMIALRGLRFHPRPVLVAGGTVLVCLFAHMSWVLFTSPNYILTSSYVAYLTEFRVLLGAEIEKAVAVLGVTAALSVATWRARTLISNSAHVEDLRAERDRAEAALAEATAASAAKSSFLGNMSHELRTPLNAVIGFSDLMLAEVNGSLSPDHHDYVRDIRNSAGHLLREIERIFEFVQLDSATHLDHCNAVDLADLLHDLTSRYRNAHASSAKFILRVNASGGLIDANEKLLQTALEAILENAVAFTPPNGEIRVSLDDGPNGPAISVQDTGPGIAEDRLRTIFDAFATTPATKREPGQGLGLGLPTARLVAVRHGGSLSVESEHGRGTCVSLQLPHSRILPGEEHAAA